MNKPEKIEATTTYSSESFCRFYLFNTVYKNGKYYWSNLIPILMLIFAWLALQRDQDGLALLAVGTGVLSPFLVRTLIQLLLRMQLRTCQTLIGKEVYHIRLTRQSIAVQLPERKPIYLAWSELWRIYRLDKNYYFYPTSKSAYILEGAQLRTEEREQLETWALAGIGTKKYRDRSKLMQGILRWESRI
jgi:hypothetical protein